MFLIVDGMNAIKEYQKDFKQKTKDYKYIFRGWGYTYKAIYPKNAKRPYHYWYKWEYNADTQNNVWTYIGKEKPHHLDIPNPPENELDLLDYSVAGNNILIDEVNYNKVSRLFENFIKFVIQT